jgi:hypothetical protein
MIINSMETALGVWRSIRNPVTLAILKGDDPVPVAEEEAASDARFVTDLGRNDAAIKSMNDYHNLASRSAVRQVRRQERGALRVCVARRGDMNRWAAGGSRSWRGATSGQPRQPPGWHLPAHVDRAYLPPMVFIQMDARRACTRRWMRHPRRRSREPHYELFAALWNLDKVVPPALERPAAPWLGFDLTSCQFAVHHMFESDDALDRFIGNRVRHAPGALHRDDLTARPSELRKQVAR